MAFNMEKLDIIKQFHGGEALCLYRNDSDTLATIMASGYFDDAANYLASGSLIIATASDNYSILKVTNTADVITTEGVTATVAELNAVADVSGRIVNVTDDLTMTAALHGGRIITVNKDDGATITLPAATGSGQKYEIYVGTTITSSNLIIEAASADDSFTGFAYGVDTDAEGDTGYTWNADANDDTITMDGDSRGGVAGDRVEIIDIADGIFAVTAHITQSGGSEVTPFSAAVS